MKDFGCTKRNFKNLERKSEKIEGRYKILKEIYKKNDGNEKRGLQKVSGPFQKFGVEITKKL